MALNEIKALIDSGKYQDAYDRARVMGYDPDDIASYVNQNYGTNFTGDTYAKDYEGQSQRNLREQGYGYMTYDDGVGAGRALKIGTAGPLGSGAVADPLAPQHDFTNETIRPGPWSGVSTARNAYYTVPGTSNSTINVGDGITTPQSTPAGDGTTTPQQQEQNNLIADRSAYKKTLYDQALKSFNIPDLVYYRDKTTGKEYATSQLDSMGYMVGPDGNIHYKIFADGDAGGWAPGKQVDNFERVTRKWASLDDDKFIAPYSGPADARPYEYSLPFGTTLTNTLGGKGVELPDGGKGIQENFVKYVRGDPSIDPYYARLFTQIDNYHEGRFDALAKANPQAALKQLGDTLRQWQQDATPSKVEQAITTIAPALILGAGLSFAAPGTISAGQAFGEALGLSGKLAATVGTGSLTSGGLTLYNGGDVEDIAKNMLLGGAGGAGAYGLDQLLGVTETLKSWGMSDNMAAKVANSITKPTAMAILRGDIPDIASLVKSGGLTFAGEATGIPVGALTQLANLK